MNATTNLQTIDVKTWMGTDILGSRGLGRQARNLLVERINKTEPVILDFRNVEVMTSAFADECFGKLWDRFGSGLIKSTIHIKGLSGNNKAIFRFVLANR
ncbi:MAG: hypothetical protein C7B46_07735 [Sulfobacillus benefaciens]|jgi:hypothetical protein|uniref:DUF4325 domain-containing protein n=1 Tax=Sulfobacillus benefaciens TaxID=453960 RepID=A0A2T2XH83_9FIRM|nr:MAG: hypothetical protein C7B46_07735 [Sulfobacillus benefaciens]